MKQNSKILVLDDEPLIRLMLCSQLERLGLIVSEAGNCREALNLLSDTEFDGAVFDYRLPDGDGLNVVRRMRDSGNSLPVVMLSGESVEIAKEAEEICGICAVLPKPPNVDDIKNALFAESTAVISTLPIRIGRYIYKKMDATSNSVFEEIQCEQWLALDFSELRCEDVSPSTMDHLRKTRCRTAIVGADFALREAMMFSGAEIEFVANTNELAALSRRPSSPSERAALLAGCSSVTASGTL